MISRFRLLLAVLVCVVAWGADRAEATNRALLVGVAGYPDPKDRLNGPPNDVDLLFRVLIARGFAPEEIRVLADGLDLQKTEVRPLGRPTRAAILEELDRLVDRSARGDFVFLHFSGHGSQQPEVVDAGAVAKEPDGLDEIFLPVDIGVWSNEKNTVANALIDDEVGSRIKAMRDRGSFVWIVVDSCHSGTMTRGVDDEIRFRTVTPADLRIPPERLTAARTAASKARTRSVTGEAAASWDEAPMAQAEGGSVSFFAAQSDQLAIEAFMPRAFSAADRRHQGLLSYFLAVAVTSNPTATYREIAQQIVAGYDTFGAKAPTPLFEGDLDQSIFGSTGKDQQAGLPVRSRDDGRYEIDGGRLHGLSEGALISLWSTGSEREPLGRARALEVGLSKSIIEPTDGATASLKKFMIGRIEERAVERTLVVARPNAGTDPQTLRVLAAVEQVEKMSEGSGSLPIGFVPPYDAADVYLRVADGKLWLLPSTGEWCVGGRTQTPFLQVEESSEGIARQLYESLRRRAIGQSVIKMAPQLAGGALSEKLGIETYVLHVSPPTEIHTGTTPPDARRCPIATQDRIPEAAKLVHLEQVPDLFHCDVLYVRLENRGDRPVDVTVLFLDSEGTLHALRETADGRRLQPGAPPTILPLRVATWDAEAAKPMTTGTERLIIIAVERGAQEDLTFVVNFDQLARSRSRTRAIPQSVSGTGGVLQSLLETAAFAGPKTRSVPVSTAGGDFERALIRVLRWTTRAPEGVEMCAPPRQR